MNWKQKQREKGWQDVMVWLSPGANKALMEMMEETGKKKQELVSEALLAYAGREARKDSSENLEKRVAALEEKIQQLDKPQGTVVQSIEEKKGEGKSYREIAQEFNERGISLPKASKSSSWTGEMVRKFYQKNKSMPR